MLKFNTYLEWSFINTSVFAVIYLDAGYPLNVMEPDLMSLTCSVAHDHRAYGFLLITSGFVRSRTKQPQLTVVIAFNDLIMYNEWTWAVYPTRCTIRNYPNEKKIIKIELADQRHHEEGYQEEKNKYQQNNIGPLGGLGKWLKLQRGLCESIS